MTTTTTRTPAIDATISDDRGTLTLAFSNGETLSLHVSQIGVDVAAYALMHGLKQKLVDAAAISRNTDTGRAASIDDKYNAVREVYDRLLSGSWNKGRADGGTVRGGLLFRALCMLYADKTPDAIRTFLEKKTPKEKAALRAMPKIATIIADLQKDTSDDGDVDAMLDELND